MSEVDTVGASDKASSSVQTGHTQGTLSSIILCLAERLSGWILVDALGVIIWIRICNAASSSEDG